MSSSSSDIRLAPLIAALVGVVLLIGGDLWSDAAAGAEPLHLLGEGLAVLVAGGAAVSLGVVLLRQRHAAIEALHQAEARVVDAESRAVRLAAEAARWRAEAEGSLRGLGEAIGRQLQRWELTEAEAEVAMLLLKGLSTKEIAAVRNTSDRTVRQQAQAIYAKAGLAGRAELSAFFLEDLLLPPPGSADGSAPPRGQDAS